MTLYFVLFIKREREREQNIRLFDERQHNYKNGQIPQTPTKYKEIGSEYAYNRTTGFKKCLWPE